MAHIRISPVHIFGRFSSWVLHICHILGYWFGFSEVRISWKCSRISTWQRTASRNRDRTPSLRKEDTRQGHKFPPSNHNCKLAVRKQIARDLQKHCDDGTIWEIKIFPHVSVNNPCKNHLIKKKMVTKMKLSKFASHLRKPYLAISMGLEDILLWMKSFLLKVP